jgi:quercetin dioxygenase-like cupin family protein
MKTFEIVPGRVVRTTLAAAPDVEAWRASPAGYPLWMTEADLPAGTALHRPQRRGEEAIFVLSGELAVDDGRTAPAGSALILEAEAAPDVVARTESTILAMGTAGGRTPSGGPVGDAAPGGRHTHLVGPQGIAVWARPPSKLTRYFTTSTCPTCRLMLMYSSSQERYASAVHSHTADELIHVLKGRIRVGAQWAEPGDTVAIPADARYRFQTDDDGYGFLNYRADASYYVAVDGTRLLEAGGGGQFVYTGDGADYISAEAYAAGPPSTR